ncbi:MAG: 2-oxoglutarate ferredoxin oxidoreductase subunit alpha [Elusimicrobia bacterium]|nr:MAG: 2-oxoglutarate ferredoxin oxidoreductase subunit alpha [Elusimicrobiota bacterium]
MNTETKAPTPSTDPKRKRAVPVEELESITIRFAGDSGDGVQLTGGQFTTTTAFAGNDLSTFPDFPAEIRAPVGTLPGVSGFQIHFSSKDVLTPGDAPQVLVAFNPAALKANIKDLEPGGTLVVNTDAFTAGNFKKANIAANPLEDGSLSGFRVVEIPMTTLTDKALTGMGLSPSQVQRCKNFFALGVMYWVYERPTESTASWIRHKFAKNPTMVDANLKALEAGWSYAETTEIFSRTYRVHKAPITPGRYRNITGNEAAALGLVAAAKLSEHTLFYGSYPITPASDILHNLSKLKSFRVKTFQAEDEIAAVASAIGASFAGHLGITGTSGPGIALKAEAIGLAVMTELPLVIINVQRGGPSTGLPTKTEQADLFQAVLGRNGECPVAVLAAATPGDCFTMAIEACRWAMKYRHPVMFLTDGYLANGSEPWKIPAVESLPKFTVSHEAGVPQAEFLPYARDPKTLARPWVIPGTPGYEHRIGGIEKQNLTGNVSYDPDNHELMCRLRADKVAGMAQDIPPSKVNGPDKAKVLVVGWGSTYGAITTAVGQLQKEGKSVASLHIRHMNPLPPDLSDIFKRYERVVVAEMNFGQLEMILRAKYLLPTVGLHKMKGQPFKVSEIKAKVEAVLAGKE